MALKIGTLNSNGLRDANKRMSFHFASFCGLGRPLQESYVTSKDECGLGFRPRGTIPSFLNI